MSDEDDIRGLCQDIMKNGLLLSERTEELVGNYSGERVDNIMVDVLQDMLSNSTEPDRQKRIILLSANIGERLGSPKVQKFAQEASDEWNRKHGE